MTTRILLAVVLCVLAVGCTCRDAQALTREQQATILAEAQDSYDRGVAARRNDPALARRLFAEAAARYQQLLDDGIENGLLHYNLGNALLQSGELGPAILHYRTAQTLIPGHAALQHNLDYARSLREQRIEETGGRALLDALLGWHSGSRTATRLNWFLIVYVAFWAACLTVLYRSAPGWKWTAGFAGILMIVLGASVVSDVAIADPGSAGVVLENNVVVRKGNGIGFEPQFLETMSEGVEFRLLEQRADWLRIELPDGTTGWIQNDQAGLVRDVM